MNKQRQGIPRECPLAKAIRTADVTQPGGMISLMYQSDRFEYGCGQPTNEESDRFLNAVSSL